MGTPKKKQTSKRRLVSPGIAKKIRSLEFGAKTGQELNLKILPDILEKVKEIILPLVPWLDKPIFPKAKLLNIPTPKKFQTRRGVYLFESGIMDIWLERSGMWFLRFRSFALAFHEVSSNQLAKIMVHNSDDFLKNFLRDESILEEMPFLKEIALYDTMILRFLAEFFKNIKALIEEREKRLCVMKEWLNLFNDFVQSLDPLLSQNKEIAINEYSILQESGHGTSRSTQNYLCPEVLEPFWKMLKDRYSEFTCKEDLNTYNAESLKDFLEKMYCLFEDVKKGSASVDVLFRTNVGRLPFTNKELAVLKELVDSIKA